MVWKITSMLGIGSVKEIREGKFAFSSAPLVLANILSVVIIRLFDEGLGDLVTPDGVLILSGILVEQADRVVEAASSMVSTWWKNAQWGIGWRWCKTLSDSVIKKENGKWTIQGPFPLCFMD